MILLVVLPSVLSRSMRDRRAVARYASLTGSPDESGRKRREKGLTRSGNARVRRGMIELAWRFLRFQKDSVLAQWFRTRTENARGTRKTMIVAVARKLLIALWRLVREDRRNRRRATEIDRRGGCPGRRDSEHVHRWSRAREVEAQHWNVAANRF